MLALLWLIPSIIFLCTLSFGWKPVWDALGVTSFTPCFLDLRVITSGLITRSHGGDPMVSNPFDPLGRTLNYPRIWLALFSLLGVNDHNVVFVGIALCALFLACVSGLIVDSRDDIEALVILIAALSLSSLFAIERGNIDLLIFALMYIGCVTGRKNLRSPIFAFAAILKIYPIAGMVIDLILRPLREKLWPVLLSVLVIAALALQFHDINLIRRGTPVSSLQSFGAISIKLQAVSYAIRFGFPANHLKQFGYCVISAIYLIGALFVALAWFKPNPFGQAIRKSPKHSEMFAIFGAIYVFCFALGSNWDYRLIFLIPTLPFAFLLIRQPEYRLWSILYVIAVICSANSLALTVHYGIIFAHLASFAAFLFVLTILAQQIRSFCSAV
ncbi:MAG: hypothetical protein WAM58_10530 [Candidatus Acidiferrum sp.]